MSFYFFECIDFFSNVKVFTFFPDADINNQKWTAALDIPGPRAVLGNSSKKALITEHVFMLNIGGILLKLMGLLHFLKVSLCTGFYAANAC